MRKRRARLPSPAEMSIVVRLRHDVFLIMHELSFTTRKRQTR